MAFVSRMDPLLLCIIVLSACLTVLLSLAYTRLRLAVCYFSYQSRSGACLSTVCRCYTNVSSASISSCWSLWTWKKKKFA